MVIFLIFFEGSIYVQRNLISLVQQTIITVAIIDQMNRGVKKLTDKASDCQGVGVEQSTHGLSTNASYCIRQFKVINSRFLAQQSRFALWVCSMGWGACETVLVFAASFRLSL